MTSRRTVTAGAPSQASALVSPGTLLRELAEDPPPLLLDVRWSPRGPDPEAYRAAHLPGAVLVDLDTDLAAPAGAGGRHPLPSHDAFTATLRRLGVAGGRPVVAYDAGGAPPLAAARAWWCLRYFGHESVRVLDGGLGAWVAEGGTTEAGDVDPEPAPDAVAVPGAMPVRDADELLDEVTAHRLKLLDVRAAERFSGATEPIDPVAGHAPGAVNLPIGALFDDRGRLLHQGDVRALVARATDGLPVEGTLGAYCGSGVTAAVAVLALHEVGISAALYPGSWSHWILDPSRPVATGDDGHGSGDIA